MQMRSGRGHATWWRAAALTENSPTTRVASEESTRATAVVVRRERETILRLSLAAGTAIGRRQTLQRIAASARVIAKESSSRRSYAMSSCSRPPLHDVGKIGIPTLFCASPTDLTPLNSCHAAAHGDRHRILADSQSPLLQLGAEIALTHHEKFDGTGYPNGLAGAAIPLSGRIVAVADRLRRDHVAPTVQAHAVGTAEAKAHVLERAGTQFDPAVVDAFERAWELVLDTNARLSDNLVVRALVEEVAIA